jgi:predicted HD superfamily hydrolase involved in NAD metabolism
MGVEAFAVALAFRHGVDPERALLAALLHDYCKNDPKESQRLAAQGCRVVPTTPEDLACKPIWHAFAAADVAAHRFRITDRELLEAIAFHPTGDPGFGPVGLVLYTADHIEPGRDFEGVCALRRAVFAAPTLREAALPVAEARLAHLEADGRPVHPRTRALLESLRQPLPTHTTSPRSHATP